MDTNYTIKLIKSANDKDLVEALDIYIKMVDEHSETSTSQIRDYIQNKYNDARKLFFYVLYANDKIVGFAEYGYLPQSEALFIDYICTNPRNHIYFYNFYHMIFEDISGLLKKKSYYIKYIITELSLKKDNENKYIDVDSNYFRQLLSFESFKILQTPYYQPYYNNMKKELFWEDFNIAIKPLINGMYTKTTVDKTVYKELLTDIYMNHYAVWYAKFIDQTKVDQFFANLINKVEKEFTDNIEIDNITLVNCTLFQNGLCQQISTENITLKKKLIYYVKQWTMRIVCLIFSIATGVFCYLERFETSEAFFCSLLTILSAAITLVQFMKERFSQK